MKSFLKILYRALIITAGSALVGGVVNQVSPKGIQWIYVPPDVVEAAGVKIPLIDENKARTFFDDGTTVFVDTRAEEDYSDGHVRGAIPFPSTEMDDRFSAVEPLLGKKDSRIILYCSGPECDMAREAAVFLVQMKYRNLMIMNAGFGAWKKAGFPVEGPGS